MNNLDDVKCLFEDCMENGKITVNTFLLLKSVFNSFDYDIEMLEKYIKINFSYIINNSNEVVDVVSEIIEISSSMKDFVKKYLDNHLVEFIDMVPKEIVFDDIDKYINKDRSLLNRFLTKNKSEYVRYLLTSGIDTVYDDKMRSVNDVVVMIVDEILEHEKLEYVDIKKLKRGGYSKVVEIGSKIIKVGTARETYRIPNDPVILQPLIRVNLADISDVNGVIEVVEKVEAKKYISNEEFYQIYKKARDNGITFVDLKPDNIGVLLKDNILNWNKSLGEDMSIRGFDGNNKEILKQGDYVLLDSDYIYNADEYLERISKLKFKDVNDFEKRYIYEKEHGFFDEQSINLIENNSGKIK